MLPDAQAERIKIASHASAGDTLPAAFLAREETAPLVQAGVAPSAIASPSGFNLSVLPGLSAMWAETLGDPRVMIAVLDGPVDLRHPCFAGAELITPTAHDPAPLNRQSAEQFDPLSAEHGTHVTSVIFGQHGSAVTGVAPRCRGIILPVFHRRANGSLAPCSQVDLARAITQAVQLAEREGALALVINISGGQFAETGQAHPLLADVIQQCTRQNILIVAAAGNQGCNCLHIPGAIPSVLAVGAMSSEGAPLDFSNWGGAYQEQGILAPGENILGALPATGPMAPFGGKTAMQTAPITVARTGTSFATPIVSGAAALLLSCQLRKGEAPNAQRVRQALLQSAVGCDAQPTDDCRRLLGGRLNLSAAIEWLAKPTATSVRDPTVAFENDPALVRAAALSSEFEPSPSQGEYIMSDASLLPDSLPRNSESALPGAAAAAVLPSTISEASYAEPGMGGVAGIAATMGLSETTSAGLLPSDCGCGGKSADTAPKGPPVLQKVFALGKLSFDYGTRPRRQYFQNEMRKSLGTEFRGIDDPITLFQYLARVDKPERRYTILDEHRFSARAEVASINWVLQVNETPIYSIVPLGPFAHEIHDLLVSFLNDQVTDGAERISLPGFIVGQTALFTGEIVPAVQPDIRAMFSWKTSALIDAIQKQAKGDRAADAPLHDFLNRVYSQTTNLGMTPPDRAINFAATDALMNAGIFRRVRKDHPEMEFDTMVVERSAICRADSDCWDVILYFYDPTNLMRARRAIRYTIDVADVVPYFIGEQREYSIR